MSSPLGPTDINRIMLNKQAREAYQAEQERIRAEQARQRQEEERRQQERERRESPPLRRLETIPAGRESVSQFDNLYESYVKQGYDPRDAFSLASARASQSELAKEGKVFTGQTLYITDSEVTGFTEYRELSKPINAPNQEIVKELSGMASAQGKSLTGYAISRDKEGNVTEVRGTVELAQPSTYLPNIMARQAAIAENIRAGYELFKAPKNYRYEVGLSDTIGISDVANRPGGVRTYPAEKIPLGRQPGENVRYLVELNDEIGLSGRNSPPADQFFYDPTNPFKVTKGIDIPVSERPQGGFREGFSGVFENIGEFAVSGGGYLKTPQYKPEAEAPALGALLNIPIDIAGGKPVGEAIQRAETDLRLLGQEIMRSPEYFAGSIAGSVAFAGATLGAGPLAKAGVSGIRGLRAARQIGELEVALNKLIPDIRGFSTVSKVEGVRRASEVTAKTAVFDVGTETSGGAFSRGAVNIPKRETTLITREPLAIKELEKAATVTKYTTEIRATEITGLKQSLVKGGDILDLSTTEMLPKTIKSAVPDIPILSKSPVIRFEKTAFEGLPRPAKEPVPIAAALTYENRDILKFARAIAKEPKEPLRGSQIDDLLGLPTRKSKPFDFSEQVAESITPAAKERAIDRTVSDLISVPSMEKDISSEFAKFLGPAAITGTSLGLGGATGQERKGRRSLIEETSESIIAYPSSVQVSPLAKTLQKDLIRSSSRLGIDQSSILRFDLGTKFGFGQVGRQRFELKTDLLPKTVQRETPLFSTAQDVNFSLFQGTRQAARSAFSTPLRLSIPTPFRTRTGFPIINFGFDKPKKKGRRKKRDYRYTERAFRPVDIFEGTALAKYFPLELE